MDIITFGDWVRRQRLALNLTQTALARRVGCARVTIKKIEHGERRPSRTMAKRLADSLGLPEGEHETFILCGLGELPVSRLFRLPGSVASDPGSQLPGTQSQNISTSRTDQTPDSQIQQGSLPTKSEPPEPASVEPKAGQGLERELELEYKLPQFLLKEAKPSPREPVFVGRQAELVRLAGRLEECLAGNGGVLFVIGGPGRGKTALLQAFARQALQTHQELVVAQGLCNAFAGMGDPYLPFRQALAMLCGDVEGQWLAGEISTEQAWRLWQGVPDTAQALLAHGKTALQLLVDGISLAARLKAAGNENAHLASQVEAYLAGSLAAAGQVNQAALQEQTRAVLRTVAAQHPLLLVIDDLQWADRASLNLLFHLGRGIAGTPVLILGAYRPEEVQAVGAADEPHPLARLLPEFKRQYGDVWLDLGAVSESEGRAFVNDYLETETHALTEDFKEELFQHTGGHPLFTVELLRDLQERGDLVRDERGAWVQGQTLDWSQLPPRVEGVIEAHLGRLDGGLKKTLEVASVEGEQFTLQVLARVLGIPERTLLEQLNRQLDQGHRLVRPASNLQVNVQNLHSYQFRHALFQQHIYQGLPANERKLLHVEVGGALEEINAERLEEAAPRLARHFLAGGQAERAVPYLQLAGDQALQLYAHQEAAEYYRQAVEVLNAAGRLKEAARTQLKLAKAFNIAYNYSAVRDTYERVFQLQHQIHEKQQDRSGVNQTIRMALRPPRRLGYSWFPDFITSWYTYKFFSRLVDEREGVPYPDIAHSWKLSEDNRRYWFYLRQNVYWSDGVQVTAHDFEYAWKLRLKTSSSQNPAERQSIDENFLCIRGAKEYYQGELQDLDQVGIRATDRFTLTVELAAPSALFLQSLFGYDFLPLPPHIVSQYGEAWFEPGNLVTNGPFMVKEWQPEKLLWLRRDPRYRGDYPGNVDEVVIHLFEDHRSAEALELYLKGEIDVVRLSIETLFARKQYPQEYTPLVTPMVHFLGFNVLRPPFDDRRVRQAMALCLNKEFIANQIFHGEQRPALGGYLSPEMPGHSPDIGLPYDLDRAQTLMAEAGFTDERTLPTLKMQYHFSDKELMPYLQSQWQKIGNIRLEYKEFTRTDELLDQVRDADLFVTGWFGGDGIDPYEMLEIKFDIAFREWRHAEYEDLLEKIKLSTNQQQRIELCRRADQIIIEEAVIVPLTYDHIDHWLVKPWVHDWKFWDLRKLMIDPH